MLDLQRHPVLAAALGPVGLRVLAERDLASAFLAAMRAAPRSAPRRSRAAADEWHQRGGIAQSRSAALAAAGSQPIAKAAMSSSHAMWSALPSGSASAATALLVSFIGSLWEALGKQPSASHGIFLANVRKEN